MGTEWLTQNKDFIGEQKRDPLLSHAYEQLAAVKGEITGPQRAVQWLHSELKDEHLYWVVWGDPPDQKGLGPTPGTPAFLEGVTLAYSLSIMCWPPGEGETMERINSRFCRLSICKGVGDYCMSCLEC